MDILDAILSGYFTDDQAAAIMTVLISITIAVMVARIVIYILQIIANWRIFKKAGESGWKSIIPIYNEYVSYKIAWRPLYFWIWLLITIAGNLLVAFAPRIIVTSSDMDTVPVVFCIFLLLACWRIANFIFHIIFSHKLSKAFGHGAGFTLGLIFLNPIFILILGFGSSRYLGADR